MLSAVYTLERMSLSHAFLLALIHCKSFHWWGSGEKHRQVADTVKLANAKSPSHLFSQLCLETARSLPAAIMCHGCLYFFKGHEKIGLISGSLKYPFLLLSERKAKCLRFFLLFLPFLLFIIKLNVAPLPPSLVPNPVARIKRVERWCLLVSWIWKDTVAELWGF